MSDVRQPSHRSPRFIEPSRPDHHLMHLLHRGNDGFISIARKDDTGNFENLCAIRASGLPGFWMEEIQDLVDKDGFFSINSHYRYSAPNAYGLRDEHGELLKLPARQGTRHLRYLTACYVDLDCHKLGITPGQAIGTVIDAQDRGDIPSASVITRSGRGIWLLWLLQEANGGLQRGFPEKEKLWSKIQFALGKKFGGLASDPSARDCSRVSRIPGSMNRIAGTRVSYWVQYDERGQVPTYTLQELAIILSVPVEQTAPKLSGDKGSYRSTIAAKGQNARWQWDYRAFWELVGLRVQIPIGTRHNHLMVIGMIIGRLFRNPEDREREIVKASHQLHPMLQGANGDRFTLKDVEKAIRSNATKKESNKSIRHETISTLLNVTEEESDQLRVILKRRSWPPADTSLARPRPLTRSEEAVQRQALLKSLADQLGAKAPTLREWEELLKERGLSASPATIQKDLAAVGIKTGRERVKKLASNSRNHNLFDDSPG